MNDLFGISEDDLRKWLEKYKVPEQAAEPAEHRGDEEVSSTKDASVKDQENVRPSIPASEEIDSLLSRISSDCNYNDWFRVACALKNEGYPYEDFRDWSAKADERFNEEACRKTWDSIRQPKNADRTKKTFFHSNISYWFNNLSKHRTQYHFR